MLLKEAIERLKQAGKPASRVRLLQLIQSGKLKATLVQGIVSAYHISEEDYQEFLKFWLDPESSKPGPKKGKRRKPPKEPGRIGRPPAQTIHPIYEYPMYLVVTDGLLSFREWKQNNPGKNGCSLDLETLKKFEGDRTQCYLVYHRDYQRNSLWGSPELEALEQECMEEEAGVV